MLTFLAPLALLGTLLLAIPIAIHLFKPRKVRVTPFSSLRWLHLTQQRLSRRIKWHQILLFFLRAAFITLLVFALAKPVFSPGGSGQTAERFVVLDVSRSMAYETAGRASPIDLGKQAAAQIVSRGMADDRTALLVAGSSTQVVGPLARDAEAYLPRLRAASVTASETDLSSALPVIRPMLAHRRPGAAVELFFITDNHQQSWGQGQVSTFVKGLGADTPVKVHLVDVGVGGAQNAWIASARMTESKRPERRVVRVQVGAVGDETQERTVFIRGLPGLPEMTRAVAVEPGKLTQTEFELSPGYDLTDKVARITIEPADGLTSDDTYFLNLDAKASLRVVLIEGDSTQIEPLRPGFHLRTALEALALANNGMIEVAPFTATAVGPKDIADADAIVLADVPELSDANAAALEARVKAGGGLAIFLGPGVRPGFYNTKLHKPTDSENSLMPAALLAAVQADPRSGGLSPIGEIRWMHPLLAPLWDPILGDLSETRFTSYYRLDALPADAPPPLATIDLGGGASGGASVPAILERTVGAGKVVLFNASGNDAWTDLPRRKSFVPLVDRLLAYLSGGGVRRMFEVGDVVALPLPTEWGELQKGQSVAVTSPSGRALTPAIRSAAGSPGSLGQGRTILRIDAAQEPGVYRVELEGGEAQGAAPKAFSFVVQAGRGDSVLTAMDANALKQWWELPAAAAGGQLGFDVLTAEALAKGPSVAWSRLALWPGLVLLGCLCLLAEMFFVHWLCPKVNPQVISSVVHRRSILTPAATREPELETAQQ